MVFALSVVAAANDNDDDGFECDRLDYRNDDD